VWCASYARDQSSSSSEGRAADLKSWSTFRFFKLTSARLSAKPRNKRACEEGPCRSYTEFGPAVGVVLEGGDELPEAGELLVILDRSSLASRACTFSTSARFSRSLATFKASKSSRPKRAATNDSVV